MVSALSSRRSQCAALLLVIALLGAACGGGSARRIRVLPTGALVNVFTEIDNIDIASEHRSVRAMQSSDHGINWSTPVQIAELQSIGARDPDTGTVVRDASDLASVAADAAGTLYVVWQDARFSNGARDGIALSRSANGGMSWSTPVQINTSTTTQAFIPTVHVRADGVIGVSYYDFRNNTSSTQTLLTDYWLVTSSDATNWTESHITGPFDLSIAPRDGGLFLGDYQALANSGATFLPFFAKTNDGNAANPTDIFVAFVDVAAPRCGDAWLTALG